MFIAELLIKCLKVNKVRRGERVLETYFIAFKSDQLENGCKCLCVFLSHRVSIVARKLTVVELV